MAHFAKLDENNIVEKIVVVGNDIPTAAGPLGENDMHPDGESYCQTLKDKFITAQPYPSWFLNANDDWQPPVSYPTVQNVNENVQLPVKEWSEDKQTWVSTGTDNNNYSWNSATSSWDLV